MYERDNPKAPFVSRTVVGGVFRYLHVNIYETVTASDSIIDDFNSRYNDAYNLHFDEA